MSGKSLLHWFSRSKWPRFVLSVLVGTVMYRLIGYGFYYAFQWKLPTWSHALFWGVCMGFFFPFRLLGKAPQTTESRH